MQPAALTLRRLQSMRDEVLKNIRTHCGQVYKKPKDAEICRSAALIAAAEIADVLKEKYGIDISPEQVAGLGIGEVKKSLFAKFMKPLQHPTHEWVPGPHGPVFVSQREADIIRKWPASQAMSKKLSRTLGTVLTESQKAMLREDLPSRFPHLAPFLETFDWKKSSIDAEIARQEAQTQGPYRYFALKNLKTLQNMRKNWADIMEGLGAWWWPFSREVEKEPTPADLIAQKSLLEAEGIYAQAMTSLSTLQVDKAMEKLREAHDVAKAITLVAQDRDLIDKAEDFARGVVDKAIQVHLQKGLKQSWVSKPAGEFIRWRKERGLRSW